jgi:hypothetical protein
MDNPTVALEDVDGVVIAGNVVMPAPLVVQAQSAIFKASKKETEDKDLPPVNLSGKTDY